MKMKEFLEKLLSEKNEQDSYDEAQIEGAYHYIQRRLDYIFTVSNDTEATDVNTEFSDLLYRPYDNIRRCKFYETAKNKALNSVIDHANLIVKMFTYVLNYYFILQDAKLKKHYENIYALLESIKNTNPPFSEETMRQIRRVYREIENDTENYVRFDELYIGMKIPQIRVCEINIFNVYESFGNEIKNDRGIFRPLAKLKTYQKFKNHFFSIIAACSKYIYEKYDFIRELTKEEMDFLTLIYKEFLPRAKNVTETKSPHTKSPLYQVKENHWEAIDIDLRKRIWDAINVLQSVVEESEKQDEDSDKSDCSKASDKELPSVPQTRANLHPSWFVDPIASVANTYIMAKETSEYKARIKLIELKLLYPRIYRLTQDLSTLHDFYVNHVDIEAYANEEDLLNFEQKLKSLKERQEKINKCVDDNDLHFVQIGSVLTEETTQNC